MALTHESNTRGGVLNFEYVPYPERTDEQKMAARLGVTRVIQAMHMLGYIET